jgi:cell division protein FtsB
LSTGFWKSSGYRLVEVVLSQTFIQFIYLKINLKKQYLWASGVTQMIECLPSKRETMSSNHSTTKRKKKKQYLKSTKEQSKKECLYFSLKDDDF